MALLLAAGLAWSDQTLVKLTAYPSIQVADGHSTVTINAEVRDSAGHLVPNGTSVQFTTTLGTFREAQVTTVNGIATAVLIAGGVAGTASVTANSSLGGAPTVLSYEFVASRSELSTAREYIELFAPSYMQYSNDDKVVGAAAPKQGVSLRYRDVEVRADELQVNINTYELRARGAKVRIGRVTREFDQLNLNLKFRHGFGTTTFTTRKPDIMAPIGMGLVYLRQKPDGGYEVAPEETLVGVVEVNGELVKPARTPMPPSQFSFLDISSTRSSVSAKRAIIFPFKKIQFQGAEIYVAGAKIIKLPLFVVDLRSARNPLVTDDIVSINDNQLALNYPQYLSLQPGLTSALRFHMGDRYGPALASDRGAFLDYELSWDRGEDMEGGLVYGGIGRDDWSLSAHQYWRIDDRSSMSFQAGMPANSGLYASGSISRQFNGFSALLDANHSQTFRGFQSSSQSYGLSVATDPARITKTPIKLSYGLTATESQSSDQFVGTRDQQGAGFTARAQTDSIGLDKSSSITGSLVASKLYGINEERGIGLVGALNLSHRLNKSATMFLTYNYTQDGFNEIFLGRHMVTLQGTYSAGNTTLNLMTSRSIGLDRLNMYGDLSYRLSKLWRFGYYYTSNRYLGNEFLDYNFVFSYAIGWREVGLTWSKSTHRIGVQLLGATF